MRRKVLAAFGLALLSVVVFDLFIIFMVPQVPAPLRGMIGIMFGIWLVYMIRNLLNSVAHPAQDHRSKGPRSP